MSRSGPRQGRNFPDELAPHEKSIPGTEAQTGPAPLRASSRVAAEWILRVAAYDATATFLKAPASASQLYTKMKCRSRKGSLRLSGFCHHVSFSRNAREC